MKVGVICKVRDKSIYDSTYKNHRLYCHKNSIPYNLHQPYHAISYLIDSVDYILYIDEHHRFLQYDTSINTTFRSSSNLLFYQNGSVIDNNIIMVSTNHIGKRIIEQLYSTNITNLLAHYEIDSTNIKHIQQLPNLFKVPIEKYTQYIGIRQKVFLLDTNNIDSDTAILLHKTLNKESGII